MPRACVTKHAKLLKAADYNYVFEKPIRSSDRYFTVLARPNNLHLSRLGTAFSKKRVKLAVARNRLKRISRESFRENFAGISVDSIANTADGATAHEDQNQGIITIDYVVLAGQHCKKATNQQLFHSLALHWQQLIKKCTKL